ncbi:unnamed protein product, partial [Gordionus sp. m RMFG-2023]
MSCQVIILLILYSNKLSFYMNWPVNWLFGASRPTSSIIHYQKLKQIESLKNLFPEIIENVKEQEYALAFLNSNIEFKLNINFPNEYPSEKPIIKVQPPIKHNWVNDELVIIGSPSLLKYTPSTDICMILKEISNEFNKNPPIPLLPPRTCASNITKDNLPYSLSPYNKGFGYYPDLKNEQSWDSQKYTYNQDQNLSLSPYYANFNISSYPNVPFQPTFNEGPNILLQPIENTIAKTYLMPEIPHEYSLLNDMSVEDLNDLNENEGKLIEQIISKLPQIGKLTRDREELLRNIEKQA